MTSILSNIANFYKLLSYDYPYFWIYRLYEFCRFGIGAKIEKAENKFKANDVSTFAH
jgi:uncharacterized membrane protein